jgi:thiosulfate/3-mercaptopyruvate sulfurtransferase
LGGLLDDVCLLDCRTSLTDPDHGARAFAAGHIAGARHAELATDLAAAPGPGGRHPLPDRRTLARRLRAFGLDAGQQLVVYDDAGGAFAARAWWLARWLGHLPSAVLDGGLQAWREPLTTEPSAARHGTFRAGRPLTRTIGLETLLDPDQRRRLELIDARAEARFRGLEEPIDPVAGHIPGARCLPFQGNLGPAGTFLPAARLAQRFAGFAEPVCYCGSGVTAAHNVLAMVHAGLPEPALYPGSFSEWIRDPARPVERCSGPPAW